MQTIRVKNFGPITKAVLQVNDFTVLIGEHATGKSTIAKLVYFFKSLREDLVEVARLPVAEVDGNKIRNKVRDKFYLFYGSTRQMKEDYEIIYDFGSGRSITLSGSPLKPVFAPNTWFSDIEFQVRKANEKISHYNDELDFKSAAVEEGYLRRDLGNLFNDPTEIYFIPDGRNFTAKWPESDFLLDFARKLIVPTAPQVDEAGMLKRNDARKIDRYITRDFIELVANLQREFRGRGFSGVLRYIDSNEKLLDRIEKKLLKAEYRSSASAGEYLQVSNGTRVALSDASSGQQESIRIAQDVALTIADQKSVSRIIEEPEGHLFPSGQQALIELLAALVSEGNQRHSSVFITTHSPYILTILNNLIFAGDLKAEGRNSDELVEAVPKIFRLRPKQVSAYMLKPDGECIPINDTADGDFSENATGMIGGNSLENYWNELQNQFDTLMELGV